MSFNWHSLLASPPHPKKTTTTTTTESWSFYPLFLSWGWAKWVWRWDDANETSCLPSLSVRFSGVLFHCVAQVSLSGPESSPRVAFAHGELIVVLCWGGTKATLLGTLLWLILPKLSWRCSFFSSTQITSVHWVLPQLSFPFSLYLLGIAHTFHSFKPVYTMTFKSVSLPILPHLFNCLLDIFFFFFFQYQYVFIHCIFPGKEGERKTVSICITKWW